VKDFNLCKSLSVICFYYKKLISCPCLNLLLLITFKDLISFVCPLSTLLNEWKLDLLIKDFEKYIDKYLNTLVLIIPQFNTIFTFLLAWNACSGHMFCGIKKNVEVGKSQILKKKKSTFSFRAKIFTWNIFQPQKTSRDYILFFPFIQGFVVNRNSFLHFFS
jgi:hypothetical protein